MCEGLERLAWLRYVQLFVALYIRVVNLALQLKKYKMLVNASFKLKRPKKSYCVAV